MKRTRLKKRGRKKRKRCSSAKRKKKLLIQKLKASLIPKLLQLKHLLKAEKEKQFLKARL